MQFVEVNPTKGKPSSVRVVRLTEQKSAHTFNCRHCFRCNLSPRNIINICDSCISAFDGGTRDIVYHVLSTSCLLIKTILYLEHQNLFLNRYFSNFNSNTTILLTMFKKVLLEIGFNEKMTTTSGNKKGAQFLLLNFPYLQK